MKFRNSAWCLLLICTSFILSGCGNDCDSKPDLNVDENQLAEDIAAIDAYLARENIAAEIHPSGLRYVITRPGDGEKPGQCDQVSIAYEGKIISNGEVFTNETNSISTLNLSDLITGWKIGIPLIKDQGKTSSGRITLFIPSVYAYGDRPPPGSTIPENANLEFEIVLFDTN